MRLWKLLLLILSCALCQPVVVGFERAQLPALAVGSGLTACGLWLGVRSYTLNEELVQEKKKIDTIVSKKKRQELHDAYIGCAVLGAWCLYTGLPLLIRCLKKA